MHTCSTLQIPWARAADVRRPLRLEQSASMFSGLGADVSGSCAAVQASTSRPASAWASDAACWTLNSDTGSVRACLAAARACLSQCAGWSAKKVVITTDCLQSSPLPDEGLPLGCQQHLTLNSDIGKRTIPQNAQTATSITLHQKMQPRASMTYMGHPAHGCWVAQGRLQAVGTLSTNPCSQLLFGSRGRPAVAAALLQI